MENNKSAVFSTIFGGVFSFAASIEWLSFAKELGVAFLFGLAGAFGGLIANLIWKWIIVEKYNKLKIKWQNRSKMRNRKR